MDFINNNMVYIKDFAVDFFLLVVFVIAVLAYYKKTFTRSVLEFASLFAAAFIAKLYAEPVANILMSKLDIFGGEHGSEKANLVTIVIVFILISVVLKFIINYIDKVFELPLLKKANKLMGLLLGVVIGFILVGAIVAGIKAIELTGNETILSFTEHSRIMKLFTKILAKIYPFISELISKGV